MLLRRAPLCVACYALTSLLLVGLLVPSHLTPQICIPAGSYSSCLLRYLTWLYDTSLSTIDPIPASAMSDFRVVPSHRLIFCRIDKNANTAFADLLCSLSHESQPSWLRWIATHWRTWADFELGCTWSSTHPMRQGMSEKRFWSAFQHEEPGWTSAAFVRDPLDRFLSGYLSKCTPDHDLDHEICVEVFGDFPVSFAHAVAVLNATDADFAPGWATNHFRRQSSFCDGAIADGRIDHTYVLDRTTSRRDMLAVLARAGVSAEMAVDAVPALDYHFPPLQQRPQTAQEQAETVGPFEHSTHAEKQRESYFSDPAHVRLLLRHFAPDYHILPIPVPPWAAEVVGEDYVRSLGLSVEV